MRDLGEIDTQLALKNFADWTDRIAAGELPKAKPQRPQGVERNVVVTMWDWGDAKTYLHDEIATDKRNPDRQRLRQDLQRDRGLRPTTCRSSIPRPTTVTYLKMTPRDPKTPGGSFIQSGNFPRAAVALLGRRDDLEQPDLGAQSDARPGRPAVAHRAHPRAADAGVLPQGLGPSVGEAVPDGHRGAPGRDVRSEDRQAHARRSVLHHPPHGVRRGQGQHAVVLGRRRARAGGRLAQHQEIPRDRRRRRLARLDAVHPRHQRQRQARRRLRRAQPAGRSDQGQAHRRRPLRHRLRSERRHHLGLGAVGARAA